MEPEQNQLLNLLFPEGCPDDWKSNLLFNDYITKLGTYTCDELNREPQKISEDKMVITEQIQEFAINNFKIFIEATDCSKKSFNQFNDIECRLDDFVENIPKFEGKCEGFAEKVPRICNLRKLNSLTLTKNQQLLEILELPQLMDSFIKDGLYEDALELATYVQKLENRHPDILIFTIVGNCIDKLWNVMLHQLLLQLQSDIQLPKCLQIVGHLRCMNVFNESELRLKFLQARNSWLRKCLESIANDDANQHLSKTIEVTRVNVFNIITQYRAIFNDDDHAPLATSKQRTVNQNCILFCWLKQQISSFLNTCQADLNRGVTSVDSFLEQCMYFGLSFSKVGCDFRLQLIPIFLKGATNNFTNALNLATIDFQHNMERFTLINKNHPTVPWKNKTVDSTQPPDTLLEFYPLANYTNKLLTSFNSLRLYAPIAVIKTIVDSLEQSLSTVSDMIYLLYLQEHQAFTSNAKDAFTRMCMCFADDLVPYLQKVLYTIYPPSYLAQYLGISVQSIQQRGIAVINREKIINKIQTLLPVRKHVDFQHKYSINEVTAINTNEVEPTDL